MKKSRGSSARAARAGKKDKNMKSKKIDFSDIPELSDKQLERMHRVGRPTVGEEPRKLIAIRLDAKVLSWLRKTAAKKARLTNRSLMTYWPKRCGKRVSSGNGPTNIKSKDLTLHVRPAEQPT